MSNKTHYKTVIWNGRTLYHIPNEYFTSTIAGKILQRLGGNVSFIDSHQ